MTSFIRSLCVGAVAIFVAAVPDLSSATTVSLPDKTITLDLQGDTRDINVKFSGTIIELPDVLIPGFNPGVVVSGVFEVTSLDPAKPPMSVERLLLNPNTASVALNADFARFTPDGLLIDTASAPAFTPLLDISVDKFVDPNGQSLNIGFPDGRRFGDDLNDILITQFLSGSVNLGFAALTEGFAAPPSAVAIGQVTPEDTLLLPYAVAPVPLPAAVWLLVAALATLGAVGRCRSIA